MIDVAVIGAGAWGTALAMRAARNGKATYLWARNPALRDALTGARMHRDALPGVAFPPALGIGRSLAECAKARCLFMVVPAQATRAALREVAPMLGESPLITLCAKGLERETLAFQSQIVAQEAPGAQLVVLSGPSFAGDGARFALPRPLRDEGGLDMSFSGLKTALKREFDALCEKRGSIDRQDRADLCASFQCAVCDVLVAKMHRAMVRFREALPQRIRPVLAVAGGGGGQCRASRRARTDRAGGGFRLLRTAPCALRRQWRDRRMGSAGAFPGRTARRVGRTRPPPLAARRECSGARRFSREGGCKGREGMIGGRA